MERAYRASRRGAIGIASFVMAGLAAPPVAADDAPAVVLVGDQPRDNLPGRPNGPSRVRVEALIRKIGRDAPSRELVDEVLSSYLPRGKLLVRSPEDAERFATDPVFVARMDTLCVQITGKPADTRTLISRANAHLRGQLDDAHREDLIDEFRRRSEPRKTLRGRVVDEADRPIAGAVASGPGGLATTDDKGEFQIVLIRPKTPNARVSFEAEGYGDGEISFLWDAIDQADGMAHRLYRQAECDGRVVNPDGDPIAGAEVQLWITNIAFSRDLGDEHRAGQGTQIILRARSDEDGRYAFRNLPPKGEVAEYAVSMSATHPDFLKNQDYFGDDQEPRPNITIPLQNGCVVEGTVVNAEGEPIPMAWVRVLEGNSDPGWWLPERTCFTDAQGKFRFGNLEPGAHRIVVEPEGQAMTGVPVTVKQDAATVVKIVAEPGEFLTGKVVDAEDKPAANVLLNGLVRLRVEGRIMQDSNEPAPARSAADGSYRIGPLPKGNYKLTAGAGEGTPGVTILAETGREAPEIRLKATEPTADPGGGIPEIPLLRDRK